MLVPTMVAQLYAALFVTLALPAMAQEPAQGADGAGTTTLDRMTVTGSRIKRTEVEQALPVTVFRKEQIEAQAITSAEQLMQFLGARFVIDLY